MSTATTDYRIRPPSPSDWPSIHRLFELSLGSDRPPGWWEWKHEQNPFGESYWLIAEADGQVVGARAFLKWQWRFDGWPFLATRPVDTATHPDWRRRGIFTNLTKQMVEHITNEGVDLIFNTPNSMSRPGYLKMGWSDVTRIPVWFKPLRPFSIASTLLIDNDEVNGNTGDDPDFSQSNIDRFFAESPIETICHSAWKREQRLHTPRSLHYFDWRYRQIPGITYRAAWAGDADSGAFVVYRRRDRKELKEIMLSETVATPDVRGVTLLRRLLSHVASTEDAHHMIACTARNTPAMWALTLSGFLHLPRAGLNLVCRPLSPDAKSARLTHWSNWRAAIGDLEIF